MLVCILLLFCPDHCRCGHKPLACIASFQAFTTIQFWSYTKRDTRMEGLEVFVTCTVVWRNDRHMGSGPGAVPDEESQVPFLVLFFPRTSYLIVYRPFRQEGGKGSRGFTQTPFWPPKDFIYRLTILIALLFVSGSLASLPLRINTVQTFKEDQRMNAKSRTSGLCRYACKFVHK